MCRPWQGAAEEPDQDPALAERLARVRGEPSGRSTERRVFVGGMPFSYEVCVCAASADESNLRSLEMQLLLLSRVAETCDRRHAGACMLHLDGCPAPQQPALLMGFHHRTGDAV